VSLVAMFVTDTGCSGRGEDRCTASGRIPASGLTAQSGGSNRDGELPRGLIPRHSPCLSVETHRPIRRGRRCGKRDGRESSPRDERRSGVVAAGRGTRGPVGAGRRQSLSPV
jgi:hypothetical protein